MRTVLNVAISFVLAMLVGSQVGAAQTAAPAAARTSEMPPSMSMPQIAPLFIDGGQFVSEITIVNDVAASARYDIVLQDQAGQTLADFKGQIPGHAQQVYKVSQLLNRIRKVDRLNRGTNIAGLPPVMIGSVEIIPEDPGIAAQLSLTYHDANAVLHTEEEFVMPSSTAVAEYRGTAINVIGKPLIALKNMSPRTLNISFKCIPEDGQLSTATLQVRPGALRLMAGCDEPADVSSDSGVHMNGNGDLKKSIGILVTSDASQEELSVFGFAWSHLPSRTLSSINFQSPGSLHSSNTAFTGVAVGKTQILAGDYSPALALTNFSDSAVKASITEAFTANASTPTTKITDIAVAPFATKTVILDAEGADSQLQNSILIESSSPPGALTAKLVSTGASNATAIEYQSKDTRQLENSGLHPWSIEHDLQSTLFLFNFTSEDQHFNIKIYGSSEPWQKALLLKPMETTAVDIGRIITTQEKDDYGVKVSNTTINGEVQWSTPGRWRGIGRLLVSGGTQHLARNFSCGQCLLMCKTVSISPYNSVDIVVDGFGTLGNGVPQLCWSGDCQTCSSVQSSSGGSGYSYSWWSENPSIATVNGATDGVSASFLGAGPGAGGGSVDISDGSCDGQASGQVNVKPSATVSLIGTSTSDTVKGDWAKSQYQGYTGTYNLFKQTGTFAGNPSCTIGNELIGTMNPTTATGRFFVKRSIVSEGCWQGSSSISCQNPVGDDSGLWVDSDPQNSGSPAGNVYNSDAPGVSFTGGTVSTPVRLRLNFKVWVEDANGVKISPDYSYWVRMSCTKDDTGAHFATDVTNDNQIGALQSGTGATTNTTWNLN